MYEGGQLQFFPNPEGYVHKDGNDFKYVYQYSDHLGNIRLSYTDNNGTLEIVEENNYYSFGGKMRGYNTSVSPLGNSTAQRWKFGGKEIDESLNGAMGTYDFGARTYDPWGIRWWNIDPKAELMRRHSPFNYAFNNPIYFMDPDGMMPCPPGEDCDTFFQGMVDVATQFNQSLLDRGERFVDNPIKSINKGLADTGGFLADVANISGIMGEENQLYNQIGATANKISNFSSLTNREKGSLFMGGVVVAAEVTISKKPSAKRLGKGNSSQSPLLLTDGGSVPNAGGKITSFTTNETSTFFRVSDNGGQGGFLTKTKPSSSAFAQEALALPPGNTASLIQKVTVPAGIQLQRSRALPAFGKRGGAEQFQILNYDQRSLIDFGTAKPFKLDSSF